MEGFGKAVINGVEFYGQWKEGHLEFCFWKKAKDLKSKKSDLEDGWEKIQQIFITLMGK